MSRFVVAALLVAVVAVVPPRAEAQGVVVQGGAEIGPRTGPPAPVVVRHRRRPGPRLMAPLRIDLGAIGAASAYGTLAGAEMSVGVHWASLSPEPTSFDIGLGVFAGGMSNSRVPDDLEGISYVGSYGEFGKSLSGGDFWRTWASARAEYFESEGLGGRRKGLGASGKLEVELYLSGIGLSPEGIFFGTYALGVYVEGAVRPLGEDVGRVQFGAGLTIRTPLVWRW